MRGMTVPDLTYTAPFVYEHGWKDIVNDVEFSIDQRRPDPVLSAVWTSDDTYTIMAGQTIVIDIETTDPFMDVTTLNATWNDTAAGLLGTVNRDSGQSVQLSLTAFVTTAVVTHLELIARSIPVVRTVKVKAQDSVSIAQHGIKQFPNDAGWANAEDAAAIASIVLAHYAQRRPTVEIRVVAQDPDHLEQILGRRISDRVTIVNGEMGLSADFHIESVQHTIQRINPAKGPIHAVVFGCERVLEANSNNPFTFDKMGAGFDDGYFGVSGVDDPGSVFIFDHPIQGQFDVGLFGT